MTYFIGIAKRGNTMVIQACRDKDYLSCEIYDYFGERQVTKKQLRERRYGLLKYLQARNPRVYSNLRYAIVE